MARPPRIPTPSAIDGYRRLARTAAARTPQAPIDPGAVDVVARDTSGRRRARAAGALRLVTFVTVLAIIVGTSVSLASADTRPRAERAQRTADRAGRAEPTEVGTPLVVTAQAEQDGASTGADEAAAMEAADTTADPSVSGRAPGPTAVAGISDAPATSTPARTAELPFTGEPTVDRVLLAGALLVLTGMLVQIAGQPMPARATRARHR